MSDAKCEAQIDFHCESVKEELICEGLKLLSRSHPDLFTDLHANGANLFAGKQVREFRFYRKVKVKLKSFVERLHPLDKSCLSWWR